MIHFEKGDATVLDGLFIMDTADYEDYDEVRLARADDMHQCVLNVQAYYAKNKMWIVR